MSTNLALVDPVVDPSRAPRPPRRDRPELVEVTPSRAQRRARPKVGYAIAAVASLGILLLAQLGISMVLSQGAYTLDSLGAEQTKLSRTQQALSEELRVLDSPQNLARNAQSLGMIANSTPVYLDPRTGRVYGTPTPAAPDESTASGDNQVPNALLDPVPLAEQQQAAGEQASAQAPAAATSERPAQSGTTDRSTATDAGNGVGASASTGASSTADVESDANPLQAPTTR